MKKEFRGRASKLWQRYTKNFCMQIANSTKPFTIEQDTIPYDRFFTSSRSMSISLLCTSKLHKLKRERLLSIDMFESIVQNLSVTDVRTLPNLLNKICISIDWSDDVSDQRKSYVRRNLIDCGILYDFKYKGEYLLNYRNVQILNSKEEKIVDDFFSMLSLSAYNNLSTVEVNRNIKKFYLDNYEIRPDQY